jgi:hypothetical protein
MTQSEFKAWFDGFAEALGETPPTATQWARIRDRVKEIDGRPVTYPVYVERYRPYWGLTPVTVWCNSSGTGTQLNTNAGLGGMAIMSANAVNSVAGGQFNSHHAMNALGRDECEAA